MGDPVTLGVMSLASTGLSAAGSLMGAQGQSSAAKAQAAKAQRAAEYARLQAEVTDVQMREEMRSTLSNIDAIRASANVDPNSPTTLAIKENETRVGDRERNIKTMAIREQAAQYDADAQYYRKAAKSYMQSGYIAAGSTLFGGLAKGFGPGGFGASKGAGGGLSGWWSGGGGAAP